jgi:hypothetical protein
VFLFNVVLTEADEEGDERTFRDVEPVFTRAAPDMSDAAVTRGVENITPVIILRANNAENNLFKKITSYGKDVSILPYGVRFFIG